MTHVLYLAIRLAAFWLVAAELGAAVVPAVVPVQAGECERDPGAAPVVIEAAFRREVDIVLCFDLTRGMGELVALMGAAALSVQERIRAARPGSDVRFAVVSHQDYPGTFSSCGYVGQRYGLHTNTPFQVDAPLGADPAAVAAAITAMEVIDGVDFPEAYARAFWEIMQPDSGVGLRPGATVAIVAFCDNLPHDCGVTEGLEPGRFCHITTLSTGRDPGRDGMVETGDDLDFHDDALAAIHAARARLLAVYAGSPAFLCAWEKWSADTGGALSRVSRTGATTDGRPLPDHVVDLVLGAIPPLQVLEVELGPGCPLSMDAVLAAPLPGELEWRCRQTFRLPDPVPGVGTRAACVVEWRSGDERLGRQEVHFGVGDVRPPLIQAGLVPLGEGRCRVTLAVHDTCDPAPRVVATVGDRAVADGQELQVPAAGLVMEVTATDAAGNESRARATVGP